MAVSGNGKRAPRRDPHPERWQARYYRDSVDKLREEYERRVLVARLHGVSLESFNAFSDTRHLCLQEPLADRKAGRKRRQPSRPFRPAGWTWQET